MKLKLTDIQKFQVDSAYRKAEEVLAQIKQKTLKGKALEDMKTLEGAVQHLEIFCLSIQK